MAFSPGDPSSYSIPDDAVVTHTHFALTVDFDKQILTGAVTLDVEQKNNANAVILDIRGLVLFTIVNTIDNSTLSYTVTNDVEYGSKLTIALSGAHEMSDDNAKYKVKIEYETSPNCTALQWLKPELTAGKKQPYLFSQCQAIHARSMFPCQDTPSVKSTYSAEIKAPANLTVLMSALRDGVEDDGDTRTHKFHQPIPIPSYLVAIAVGALVSKQVGPRSHVWAEAEFIDDCAYEFAETETMLKLAEDLCGPYVWGIYDLLILPPSFPFGGMENPCLTFVTPTLLAGDRSLVNVVAHEITHSWTGNLVTNANFEHFWLNEGFTVFVERKIDSRMYGEQLRHFYAITGLEDLREEIQVLGETNQLTNLVPNLAGVDPSDAFSIVPYEKGHTLLFYLEELLGGAEVFNPFLRSYLDKYKYRSIVTDDWKKYLYKYFANKTELLDKVDWEAWFHKPGMPPVIPKYDRSAVDACTNLANRWIEWNETEASPFNASDLDNLTSSQRLEVLSILLASKATLSTKKLQALQDTYALDSVKNSEIRCTWLRLCIRNRWADKVDAALTFATELGRMKFVRPIFREFYEWQEMRQKAVDVYLAKKNTMMYVTARMVAKDLHLDG